jgi:hypothetical protein
MPYMKSDQFKPICLEFRRSKILNAVLVFVLHNRSEYKLFFYSNEPFDMNLAWITNVDQSVSYLFYDYLKNMKGHAYRAIYLNSYYDSMSYARLVKPEDAFLDIILKHQNATVKFNPFLWNFYVHKADFILTPESPIISDINLYIYMFYDNGYCAMVPLPKRVSFFEYIMEPFELWSWLCIAFTVLCLVVVWHFLNKRTSTQNSVSATFFLFAIFAFFMGQGVSIHHNRMIQKVLVQLMVLMTFILGNAYQSVLISMMTNAHEMRITTVQGLIDSDFRILSDYQFKLFLTNPEDHKILRRKILPKDLNLCNVDFKHSYENNIGFVMKCSDMEIAFLKKLPRTRNIDEYYYKVSEKVMNHPSYFISAPKSPYKDRLSEYSLRIFEAGLRQTWIWIQEKMAAQSRAAKTTETHTVDLKDVIGAFYCVGIGYIIATITFVLEKLDLELNKNSMVITMLKRVRRKWRQWRKNKIGPINLNRDHEWI